MVEDNPETQASVAETKEEVKAEVSPEPSQKTSPQVVVPLEEQVRTSELYRRMQSEKDKAFAEAQKTQAKLREMEDMLQQMKLDREREALGELGDDPKVKSLVERQFAIEKKLAEANRREAELKQRESELALVAKRVDAESLAKQFGCTVDELMEAESKAEMERIAKTIARYKTPPAPKVTTPAIEHEPDSGISNARARSYAKIEEAFIKGDVSVAEYKKARAERGLD